MDLSISFITRAMRYAQQHAIIVDFAGIVLAVEGEDLHMHIIMDERAPEVSYIQPTSGVNVGDLVLLGTQDGEATSLIMKPGMMVLSRATLKSTLSGDEGRQGQAEA